MNDTNEDLMRRIGECQRRIVATQQLERETLAKVRAYARKVGLGEVRGNLRAATRELNKMLVELMDPTPMPLFDGADKPATHRTNDAPKPETQADGVFDRAMTIACPTCKAKPGEPCAQDDRREPTFSSNDEPALWQHHARRAAVEAPPGQPPGTIGHPVGAMNNLVLGEDAATPEAAQKRGRKAEAEGIRRASEPKKLPKQRKRAPKPDAKPKPKPNGVGPVMTDSYGAWRRCLKCKGDVKHVLGQARRDKSQCHRPRDEVIALRECRVEGWRYNELWQLDLSAKEQKGIPAEIETVGAFHDWVMDKSMGEPMANYTDALAEFKTRLERVYEQAQDSRQRKARAKRDAAARGKDVME